MPRTKRISCLVHAAVFFLLANLAAAQTAGGRFSPADGRFGFGKQPSGGKQNSYQVSLSAKDGWTDTKIDLSPGDRVTISASGSVQCPGATASGPAGLARGWKDLVRILPVNNAGRCALIGRIGQSDVADAFAIGEQREMQVRSGGRLWLGVNAASNEQPAGTFDVKVEIVPVSTEARRPALQQNADFAASITPELLGKIPRRVADPDGRPGDMVNFLILGSEANLRLAFESAGWVKVDRSTKDALLHGILSSVSKASYVEMPMSILTLFGRPQDYGFAHAEPITVVATRHHLRIWKAPFEVDGQPLWIGAGTHDIGFDRDQRNGGITHKIDPAIDGEREYIGQTLGATGLLSAQGYVTPADKITEALTATGGSFHSDGRILVMSLASSGADRSADFGALFCSVLANEHPDGGDWGDCSRYLSGPATKKDVALASLPSNYRVLILPGFLSSCVSSTPALKQAGEHLHKEHALEVEYLQLPNASSEDNGKLIADYLKSHAAGDVRKYIVVGYSKGAPDFQVGIAHDPAAAANVAAFVSLAGAIGGSPVADALPAMIQRYTKSLNLGTCQGDIAQAARSLRRDLRHDFLTSHPDPVVPTYSLAAISDKDTTSKMLLQAWQMLAAYDTDQDSQLTKHDAIVPGSTFLGTARADHLAVALAFEQSAEFASLLDHNHYPRVTLLESIVRYVAADLDKPREVKAAGK
jgi:hypothetical protein